MSRFAATRFPIARNRSAADRAVSQYQAFYHVVLRLCGFEKETFHSSDDRFDPILVFISMEDN